MRDAGGAPGALLPRLRDPDDREAVSVAGRALTYRGFGDAALAVAGRLERGATVAVWAAPSLETCVGVVGALAAGAVIVPLNPRSGTDELAHVLADARPARVVAAPDADLPEPLRTIERVAADPGAGAPRGAARGGDPDPPADAPAFVFYTSGTTGPPKGAVLPRRAVAANLDALAEVWEWGPEDILTHGLPMFHVHGLILGLLGPLRTGGALRHVGRFSAAPVAAELAAGATMVFGVPTMYADLAGAAEADPEVAAALGRARLLVSGSAPLPGREHERIERATGQRVAERYGLTETLINCAAPASGDRRPGSVGPPLPGVDLRLVDEEGRDVGSADPGGGEGEGIGEVLVRGPNLFLGYLGRPEATAAALADGWFRTGDLAGRDPDGAVRILGRRSTDLIKTGGFKVGAGEVEAALLRHPAVGEVAVTGEPDERLGQRIVAWVVPRGERAPDVGDLQDLVAGLLAPHKRPREVRIVRRLPRNEMGKVLKTALRPDRPA